MSSDEIKDGGPRKKSTVDILDFITELPDDVRLEIISLLCIKDAVRTCVLSKKWLSLWTLLSKFTFTEKKLSTSIENYILFVDSVVSRALSPKVTTFAIEGGDIFRYDSHIKDWLNFAIQRRVEDLVCISDSCSRICEIPEKIFDCSSLIKLHMRGLFFRDANPPWNWQFLKIIQLGFVPLNDLSVSSLLSGCPVLESVEFYSVNGLNSLLIGSKKLKNLILKDLQNDTGNLEINAPYLEYLNIAGNLRDLQCRLLDVSALATAKLTFTVVCGLELGFKITDCHEYHKSFISLIQQNIGKLRLAKEITMGAWFFEVCN
ncbi:hypothetical protein MTR67_036706 [Solanum verrucosum]|uniref:F-box family protein n=1 Tax=Solanum verrucosum TaxID=315347 RepID=A0AAF0ZL86_SOLVR|nr:hypothetical protein MTR67_036706 [Solanum verrucosum]